MYDHPPTPSSYLFGSKAGDVIAGIVAAVLWWVGGIAVVPIFSRANPGPVAFGVVAAFLLQLFILGRRSTAFWVSQILTAILLPLVVLGLLFGACLLSGGPKF